MEKEENTFKKNNIIFNPFLTLPLKLEYKYSQCLTWNNKEEMGSYASLQ